MTTVMPLDSTSLPTAVLSRRSAPLHVSGDQWALVPVVIVAVFALFVVLGRKFDTLGGLSVRHWLVKFVSIETLYKTLGGATVHTYHEEWAVEVGHQVFVALGVVFLAASFILNNLGNNEQRYAFYVLQLAQMCLFVVNTAFDAVMIHLGHLRSVRSLNTKLRFAHCTYQVFLFCTDVLSSGGVGALPVDCYIWATIHYSYEAVGLLLEGLNVIGMSEWAIIILINYGAVTNTLDATGPVCAFGITCLVASSLSLVGGMAWKVVDARRSAPYDAGGEHGDCEGAEEHLSERLQRHEQDEETVENPED